MKGVNFGSAAVIGHIPRDSVGIEIGVWMGGSSEQFLTRARHLHMVDPWAADAYRESDEHGGFRAYLKRYSAKVGGDDAVAFDKYYNAVYDAVVDRFKDQPVTIHRCTSAKFFSEFDGRADWAYLDGSHSFDGCLADLRAAGKLVSFAIFGDDYRAKDGVTLAVDAYIKKTVLTLELLGKTQYMIRVSDSAY